MTKTTITVTLEIECEYPSDALYVVNRVLDEGDFQDAIKQVSELDGPILNLITIQAE